MFHKMLCSMMCYSKAIYHLPKNQRPKAPKRPGPRNHGENARWKRFQP